MLRPAGPRISSMMSPTRSGGRYCCSRRSVRVVVAHQRARRRHARDEFEQQFFDHARRRSCRSSTSRWKSGAARRRRACSRSWRRAARRAPASGWRRVPGLSAGASDGRAMAGWPARLASALVISRGRLRRALVRDVTAMALTQALALSCSHWRMMETVSRGLRSAISPTFCTDWAWTWPCTWAMSIIFEVSLGSALKRRPGYRSALARAAAPLGAACRTRRSATAPASRLPSERACAAPAAARPAAGRQSRAGPSPPFRWPA